MSQLAGGLVFVAAVLLIGYLAAFVLPRRKTRQTEATLAPLAPVIAGTVSEGRVVGTYHGLTVEARPTRGWPPGRTGGSNPPPSANMFELTLAGLTGAQRWECDSTPSPLGGFVSELWPRVTHRMIRGRFEFKQATTLGRAPRDDSPLTQRLRSAGLLDELAALRWGAHPHLPRVSFVPGAAEEGRARLAEAESRAGAALRAAGRPDLEAVVHERLRARTAESPGRLTCEVEMGTTTVPTPERFRELLDRAVRIAEINARENAAGHAPEPA